MQKIRLISICSEKARIITAKISYEYVIFAVPQRVRKHMKLTKEQEAIKREDCWMNISISKYYDTKDHGQLQALMQEVFGTAIEPPIRPVTTETPAQSQPVGKSPQQSEEQTARIPRAKDSVRRAADQKPKRSRAKDSTNQQPVDPPTRLPRAKNSPKEQHSGLYQGVLDSLNHRRDNK